jgi:mono/diheme cytochrome c family protein
MKLTLLSILAISLLAGLCSAQDDAAYSAAMKAVNASNRPLRAAIMAKDTAAASTEATKIATAFDTVLAYWKAKKVDDAIGFATTAHDAAKTIADAKDADAQAAAMQKLSGTCNACHMAHRGGTPPDFVIK